MKKEDRATFLEFLDANWSEPRKCNICNHDGWSIHPYLWELRGCISRDSDGAGKVVPTLAVECKKCGHLVFFNAIAAGLIQPDEDYNIEVIEAEEELVSGKEEEND